MKSQQIKNSFQSGVLSPRLSLRSDIQKYLYALEDCTNFIVNPQGGIVMREGFEDVVQIPFTSEPCRIFQFHKGGAESDMIVVVTAGDSSIRFYIDGVLQADVLTHDYLQSELEDLYFTNQEVTGVLCHKNHPPYYIEIELDGTITGAPLPSNAVPYADYADANSPTASLEASDTYTCTWVDGTTAAWLPSRAWTFTYGGVIATGNAGNVKEYDYTATSADMQLRLNRALSFIPELNTPDTNYTVNVVGTVDNTSIYEIIITGVNAGKTLQITPTNTSLDHYVSVENTLEETETTEPAWSYFTYVFHNGNYYQCIKSHTAVAVTNEPPNTEFWVDLGATKPDTFDWQYPDGNAWAADTTYSPGGRGFPTVAAVFQQRMILMANPGFTMGVFGSRLNEYKDFKRGPQDDDPFFFAIDTSDTPTIKWAESQDRLILGTSSGDYTLKGLVTLTPSDVNAYKQNNARSHAAKAVTVNNQIFYIEQGKEKLRTSSYLDEVKTRSSSDISLIAEHLMNERAKRIVLMQTPEVVMFVLREDGSMIGISYSHENQTSAWYEFQSKGTIVDIAAGYTVRDNSDEDELWAVITYDGGTTHWLERMPYPHRVFTPYTIPRDEQPAEGSYTLIEQGIVMLDGWLTGTIVNGDNNVIQGLDQYEGLTVACLVNDAYTGEYTVSSGAIILETEDSDQNYAGVWVVGLSYIASAKTFEMAIGQRAGTAIGTPRRWNKFILKTLDSALPKVNTWLPPDREPETLMGIPEIIQSGLQDRNIRDIGWGDGSITILQDRPYPTNVIGFAGEFNTNFAG